MSPLTPLVLVCLALVFPTSEGLSCLPCDQMQRYCPHPPPAGTCEVGTDVCGCCQICKPKAGEDCSGMTPSCEGNLVCRTGNGCEYQHSPPWYIFAVGVCTQRTTDSTPQRCYDPAEPNAQKRNVKRGGHGNRSHKSNRDHDGGSEVQQHNQHRERRSHGGGHNSYRDHSNESDQQHNRHGDSGQRYHGRRYDN